MSFEEIKKELERLDIKPKQVCEDLGFDRGDWGNFSNGKRPLPESRRKALFYYIKYISLVKEVESLQK